MLAVKDLHKSYGNKEVLRGVSFTVSKGQIVSLLGSNGSGKTTTFKCLLNLTDHDEGSISYNGARPDRRKMGYLPEERSLFFDLEAVSGQRQYVIDELALFLKKVKDDGGLKCSQNVFFRYLSSPEHCNLAISENSLKAHILEAIR